MKIINDCIFIHLCVYAFTCIYTYICVYIYIHTHTYVYFWRTLGHCNLYNRRRKWLPRQFLQLCIRWWNIARWKQQYHLPERTDFHLYPTFTLLIDGSSSMDFCCIPYLELECFFYVKYIDLMYTRRAYKRIKKNAHKYT